MREDNEDLVKELFIYLYITGLLKYSKLELTCFDCLDLIITINNDNAYELKKGFQLKVSESSERERELVLIVAVPPEQSIYHEVSTKNIYFSNFLIVLNLLNRDMC